MEANGLAGKYKLEFLYDFLREAGSRYESAIDRQYGKRTRSRKAGMRKASSEAIVRRLRGVWETATAVYNAMDRLANRPTGVVPMEIDWAESMEQELSNIGNLIDSSGLEAILADKVDEFDDLVHLARIVAFDAQTLAYGQEGEEDYEGMDVYQALVYADELERKLLAFMDMMSDRTRNRKIGGMLGNTIASKPKRPMKPKPGDDKKPEKPKRLRRRVSKATGYDAIDWMDTIFDDKHFDTARNMDSAGRKSKSFLEDFVEMDAPSEFKEAQIAVEEFLYAISDWWTHAEEDPRSLYDYAMFEDEYGNVDYEELNYQREKDMDMFARDADNAEMKFLDEWRKLDDMYGE